MSVTAQPIVDSAPLASQARARAWRRLALAVAAIVIMVVAMTLLALWLGPVQAPPARNPFGMGLREAAPSGALGATLLSIQAGFYRNLQTAVSGLKENGTALVSLLWLGFAYGIFHAAGPGHGKAVISAYIMADEKALRKGFGLSLAAALVQALVAIAIVSTVSFLLRATASTMNALTLQVEGASFAFVALLGALMTWRKAGKLLGTVALARDPLAGPQEEGCDHTHLPPPETFGGLTRWREMAVVAVSAGARPCAGALIVLVFALAQGLFAAGIAATFAMALGTALTTGLIAAVAVFAKGLALRLAGGRGATGAVLIAGLELLAAAFVAVLGTSLLFGLSTLVGG